MIRLEGHGYRLSLSPEWGATVMALDWWRGDVWLPLLEPLIDPAAGMQAGSFVMAPFANRIAQGRFRFDGQDYVTAMNPPDEGMAIHGFARDHAWDVESLCADRVSLRLQHQDTTTPWSFDLRQSIDLSPDGVCITLEVTNTGARAMPFGLGLHPWFRKLAGATLSFERAQSLCTDSRGLPLASMTAQPAFAPQTASPLSEIARFDGVFPDWPSRQAEILWPEDATQIRISAQGAFRHLHVYVPDDRAVFCAEPVSHLPDAVNRPALAQMDVLAPGASLSGTMVLQASARHGPSTQSTHNAVQPEVSP